MFPSLPYLKGQLTAVIGEQFAQGRSTSGFLERLEQLPASYDAYLAFAASLADMPMREDWPYVEPETWEDIQAACDPDRPLGALREIAADDSRRRVETAFLASVCGSILGKPLEINPTLPQLREAFEQAGEWPLADYVSEPMLRALGKSHWSWFETTRERIRHVAPDDDVNYTLIGMLAIEQFGVGFTKRNIRDLWLNHLPLSTTFGPERTMLIRSGMSYLEHDNRPFDHAELEAWPSLLSPGSELCGAAIRADAYGYACPGNPALAAELAWRDASFTHLKTGVYATMFIAAAIAAAQVLDDRLAIVNTALQFVPQRSRFYEIAVDCRDIAASTDDWLDAYERMRQSYGDYRHCRIYFEIGTLINTLLHADNVGDGICKQVMQGNDTDSFGATAGSLLGAYFGPEGLDPRWLAPFGDTIHTGLANLNETSLSALAARVSLLPEIVRTGSSRIEPSELYVFEHVIE
ncbi:ADP-ribosylglycohydrolase family protein [Paenibacillus silvisoli]|uniref:ADP-ribosylglycohydrolase family protein n=1 Tax=Paenibacillus silvisoli TaxID=3110539 RepID=UPI002805A7DF|nr:ADP-ribosylglycohydrolase family protein [Paenibacillus silvisoli]